MTLNTQQSKVYAKYLTPKPIFCQFRPMTSRFRDTFLPKIANASNNLDYITVKSTLVH